MKLARVFIAAAAVCAAAAVPAQAAMAAPAHSTVRQVGTDSQHSSQAGFKLPYTDPDQAGWLTLCGTNLKPVTEGSIFTKPFIWRAVGNVPTPEGYRIQGVGAALFAYQPRPYTPAGAWSGAIMTAESLYSNLQHPMAQATPIDQPLTYMVYQFQPIWDHLIELRLYIGAPGRTTYVNDYAAADIQVIGNTWHLVAGGGGSCTSGTAASAEALYGLKGAQGMPKPTAATKAGKTLPAVGLRGSARSTGSAAGVAVADASHTSTFVPVAAGLGGAAVLIVALVVAGGIWRRRQRAIG
jgi:hypothetical protein